MSSHPPALRNRVIQAHHAKQGSYRQLAKRFILAVSTVQNWIHRHQATGTINAQRPGRKADPAQATQWRERLTNLLAEQNDLTLNELVALLKHRYDQQTSTSAVDRWLKRLGITRKKRRSGQASRTANESAC